LLQPVEEMTLTTLGKLRDKRRRTLFRNWFLLVTFVGLTFACYAPAYVHLLLRLLYGNAIANKTSAPFALAWYCIYVLFMAINGMLEAFIQGTASLDDITQYNRWMLVFTLIYMCSVIYLLPLFGAAGLIMANIIKMTCRISVCITYYLHEPFTSLLPHKRVLALCFVSFILTQLSSKYTYNHDLWFICMHICIGIACWTMTACVVWRYHATQLKRIDKID
jgi:oligosaccharide translocation protein RFT1